MLTISTIPEALAELDKRTGRSWTDSELFDVATRYGVELHAAPPITAQTTIQKFVDGVGLVEKFRSAPGHSRLAVLFPWQVGQLWLSGETMASHTERHDEIEDEHQWFTEPVRVTREQVLIKAESLKKILAVWGKAQAWEGKRYKGPEWMFITPQPAPDQSPATPAPVEDEGASDGPAKPTATVDRGWVMKRAALIKKHERQWLTIYRDLQDASDNDLSKAAKAPGYGDWFEADALNWARQRGKLSEALDRPTPSPATPFTGLTHRTRG